MPALQAALCRVADGRGREALRRAAAPRPACRPRCVTARRALCELAAHADVDTVMAAIVGAAGLGTVPGRGARRQAPAARQQGGAGRRRRALHATRCSAGGATLLPIDSEHSAIFQCLPDDRATWHERIDHIVLTASGGPFRGRDPATLRDVTPDEACAHPNWVMGRKISVDSATMMNKALEVIEAHFLFDLAPEQIEVVIHPQSIIHSMVVCRDQSVLAQLGTPDMRVPIAYGLAWPERIASGAERARLAHARRAHLRGGRPAPLSRPRPGLGRAARARRAATRRAQRRQRGGGGGVSRRNHPLRPDSQRQRPDDGGRDPASGRGRLARGAARPRRRGAAARGPVPEQLRRIDHRMTPITTILAFLFTLGVLIVVHEYGHYRVAVACGVKVLRFSVGFGRVLWRRQPRPDGTEFVVCALPLGGYVRMLDEREGPVAPDERHRAFNRKPLWQRAAIVAAGPLANLLLAVALYAARSLDRRRRAEGGARPAGRRAASPSAPACAPATGSAPVSQRRRRMAGHALADRPALAGHAGGAAWREPRAAASATATAAASAASRSTLASLGDERGRRQADAAHRPRQRLQRAGARRRQGRAAPAPRPGLRAGDRVLAIDGRADRRRVAGLARRSATSGKSGAAVPMHWRIERGGRAPRPRGDAGGRPLDGGKPDRPHRAWSRASAPELVSVRYGVVRGHCRAPRRRPGRCRR